LARFDHVDVTVLQEIAQRTLALHVEDQRHVALRIAIDHQHLHPAQREAVRKIDGGGRLAGSALGRDDGEFSHFFSSSPGSMLLLPESLSFPDWARFFNRSPYFCHPMLRSLSSRSIWLSCVAEATSRSALRGASSGSRAGAGAFAGGVAGDGAAPLLPSTS